MSGQIIHMCIDHEVILLVNVTMLADTTDMIYMDQLWTWAIHCVSERWGHCPKGQRKRIADELPADLT